MESWSERRVPTWLSVGVLSALLVPGAVILTTRGAADEHVAEIPVVSTTAAPTPPTPSSASPVAGDGATLALPAINQSAARGSAPATRPARRRIAKVGPGSKVDALVHTDSIDAAATEIPAARPATSRAPTSPPATSQPVTLPATPPLATTRPAAQTLDATLALVARRTLSERTYACSAVHGGAFANYPFEDVAPSGGGVLIGFRIGLGNFVNNEIIKFIQPIYLTPQGELLGRPHGKEQTRTVEAKAPEGYAVGALDIRGGGSIDSLTITYLRIIPGESRLDVGDAYVTRRIGGAGGGTVFIGGDGTPIVGVCGRVSENNEYVGLGLLFLRDTPALKPH